jgi:hypothetical protein
MGGISKMLCNDDYQHYSCIGIAIFLKIVLNLLKAQFRLRKSFKKKAKDNLVGF